MKTTRRYWIGYAIGRSLRPTRRPLGVAIHWVSDVLHLAAHAVIGDPDWRMRNGVTLGPDEVVVKRHEMGDHSDEDRVS